MSQEYTQKRHQPISISQDPSAKLHGKTTLSAQLLSSGVWGGAAGSHVGGHGGTEGSSCAQNSAVLEVTYHLNVQGCMRKNALPQPYIGRS